MKSVISRAFGMICIMTVLCGGIYPLAVTGISQAAFPEQANGSMIKIDDKAYGSKFMAQKFTGNQYMWGRIMNIDAESFTDAKGTGYFYAAPDNISPASHEYSVLVAERVQKIKESNPDATVSSIPVDLVTNSGSGLDPHISLAAAEYQVPRLAKERHMAETDIRKIVDTYTTDRFLGVFGEPVVNVLQVNLALDGLLK